MVGNTYSNVWIENVTATGIAIPDLGIPVLEPGVAFDIATSYTDDEIRWSNDFRNIVENDLVSVSGVAYRGQASAPETSDILFSKEEVLLWLAGVDIGPANIYFKPASPTITLVNLDDNVKSITASGISVSGTVNLETIGGLGLSADGNTNTITVSGGGTVGSFVGSFFQVEFTKGGTAKNTWLAVGDASLAGNRTPWVVAFPCQLVGMVFSNINDDVDTDVRVHISRQGDGNSDTLEYTWSLTNVRTASNTSIPPGTLELNPGDKVAVYLSDTGGNPRDVFVGLYLEVVERETIITVENWSGNF